MRLLLGTWRAHVVNNKPEDDRSITWETQSNSNIFHDDGYMLLSSSYILALFNNEQFTIQRVLSMDIFTESNLKGK